jgi:putative thioredoxin
LPGYGIDIDRPSDEWGEKSMSLLDGGASAATQVKDVTTASFRQDVVADSMAQPVLVDFWAPWCGPCKQLGPVIERVVTAAQGRVKLVKMNIDDHPQIAGQLGIQSIPAVIAFSKGQPVDGFVGALPESQIIGFIERLVGPVEDDAAALLETAAELAEAGDVAGAIEIYGNVLVDNGENIQALAGIIKLYVESGNLDAARGYLEAVPEGKESDPAIVAVRAALDLAEQVASLGDTSGLEAAIAANPNDHQSRFDLALAFAAAEKKEEATDALIEIIKRDRAWNDDGARVQLLQFFDAWGPMDEMTKAGRRKLSGLLFR